MEPWNETDTPWQAPNQSLANKILAATRIVFAVVWTVFCVIFVILLRLIEWLTGRNEFMFIIINIWAKVFLKAFNISIDCEGEMKDLPGAIVANHSCWLDIVLLFALTRSFPVAKKEVGDIFFVGRIAKILRVEFIVRKRMQVKKANQRLAKRLRRGERIMFYPEGTTTDNLRVIDFKRALFQGLMDAGVPAYIQPLSIAYPAPKGASENFFGFWGDMSLGRHINAVAALGVHTRVKVKFGEIIDISEYDDFKLLASKAEEITRQNFEALRSSI